jgi:UDPglucose 6-dehydrogenase
MRIGVVGAGYVGLTSAVCLAERGHATVCVDVDAQRVRTLTAGEAPIDEPGLPQLLASTLRDGTLRFSGRFEDLAECEVVFVCVPTPSRPDGSADITAVDAAVGQLNRTLHPGAVVVMKSTVPVGTTRMVIDRLHGTGISAVSNPEFLRESHAIYDFRHPDRILIGAADDRAADVLQTVYGVGDTEVLRMSPESAELAKYASNAFLAVKISYANSLAQLCSRVGADVADVARCMGADVRIGKHFLQPGPGWGGSCLPKDTAALLDTGRRNGVELAEVASARDTNLGQADRIVAALSQSMAGPLATARIAAFGLTFKAGTCDVRDSPALFISDRLASLGAQVSGYDPRLAMIDQDTLRRSSIAAVDDAYLAAKAADAIVVFTEWPEFRDLDWVRIAGQAPDAVVLDTRNLLDPTEIRHAGLRYLGNGKVPGF